MEELKILEFISHNYGDSFGYGSGDGNIYCDGSGSGTDDSSGYSDGTGYGKGCGSGYGSGISYGYGRGYGCGVSYRHNSNSGSGCNQGSGLISINGKKVYMVDGIATTISHIHGNIAKGTIVKRELTETPCYIVKEGRYFAHGKTLAKANAALQEKLFEVMPVEERITAFWECHKKGIKYPTKDFFEWHHKLTGSCLMGRQQFAKDHDVDFEGEMTVEEFITLTEKLLWRRYYQETGRELTMTNSKIKGELNND